MSTSWYHFASLLGPLRRTYTSRSERGTCETLFSDTQANTFTNMINIRLLAQLKLGNENSNFSNRLYFLQKKKKFVCLFVFLIPAHVVCDRGLFFLSLGIHQGYSFYKSLSCLILSSLSNMRYSCFVTFLRNLYAYDS